MSSPKIDPFAMEPIRANVLQLHQITKEVSSLELSIQRITESLAASEAHLKENQEQTNDILSKIKQAEEKAEKEKQQATPAFLRVEGDDDLSQGKRTSEVYLTEGNLPKRFEEPCMIL
jgi:chromosome segregation ATPase